MRRWRKNIAAPIRRPRTAAPPIAIPAIAPPERGELEECEDDELVWADAVEVPLGEEVRDVDDGMEDESVSRVEPDEVVVRGGDDSEIVVREGREDGNREVLVSVRDSDVDEEREMTVDESVGIVAGGGDDGGEAGDEDGIELLRGLPDFVEVTVGVMMLDFDVVNGTYDGADVVNNERSFC